MDIGFIGLGNMGQPIAKNLLEAGHRLLIFNRTKEKAISLISEGALMAQTSTEVAQKSRVVITMLSDDEALQSVVFGKDGPKGLSFIEALPKGGVHVSMSTISIALAKELTQAHLKKGQAFVSAPVFGRPDAAAAKRLSVIVAGEEALIERLQVVFQAIGQAVHIVGKDPYLANLFKIAGNFLIMGAIEALGEAFALVQKSGGDPEGFLKVVNASLFHSPLYDRYGGIILNELFEPAGFRLELGLKDVKLALEASEKVRVPLALASLIKDHFLASISWGMAQKDWAALGLVPVIESGLKKP